MKNNIKNTNLELKSNDLKCSINDISKTVDGIKTIRSASGIISDSCGTSPLNQIFKADNYLEIAQIPNLYIPKIAGIAERLGGFQNKINQICSDMDEICSILAEYNYLLPLTLSLGVYSELLEYLNNTKESDNREKEIDKLLLKLFSHKKWEMASDIVNKLHENDKIAPKRIVILEDCIRVLKHNSRRTAANTILPVLITQIEGIWADILGAKDKNKLKKIIDDMKIDKYVNPARELLADILFQYTKTELPIKPDFCRNKILHGEEVEYGSIYNVIRAFLIIEFLDFIKTDDELEENIAIE